MTIRITWWGGQSRHEYTQKLLDRYTELNPHVHFEATPSGWDGYFEKLATDTATGGMPDIVQMDYLYISTYASNNSLADLTPYIENGTIDTSNIDESIVSTGNVSGVQVGMPLSTSLIAVGYSPAALEGAGQPMPTSDWTWEDFKTMTQAIYDKTGNVGCCTGPVEDVNIFNYWVRQHGQRLFAEDKKSLGYADDAVCADFFQMWKDLMDSNAVADPDEYAQIASLGLEGSPMATDDCGFHFSWNNYTNLMAGVNPNLKLVTPPKGENNGLWIKPGMFFSVAQTSKVKPHVYLLDYIAKLWQSGDVSPEKHSLEYAESYYGKARATQVARSQEDYAAWAVAYGPNEDDHAGDQFYNHVPRMLISQFLADKKAPSVHLRWLCDRGSLQDQAAWCRGRFSRAEKNYGACQKVSLELTGPARTLYEDSVLLQPRL